MKILTYNFLTSASIKVVKVGYPLKLEIQEQQTVETEFNPEFITRILPRLEWATIIQGATAVGLANTLPIELTEQQKSGEDEEFLRNLHHVILEVDIIEGALQCPETGRSFPITKGIPNMLLNEDEV